MIAATHRNLEEMIAEGKFRHDLYYRLSVIPIHLPPLRERREDIEPLADYFREKYNRERNKSVVGVSRQAMDVMRNYSCPGNVRDLENKIERAVVLAKGELITEADLQLTPSVNPNGFTAVAKPVTQESAAYDPSGDTGFLALLAQNNFEIGKTAQELGQNRLTVAERFKGLCLKALAEHDWDIERAARVIAQDERNLKHVEAKMLKYYDNTMAKLESYTSLEQLQQEVAVKFKNMPRKFHRYVLELYEVSGKG